MRYGFVTKIIITGLSALIIYFLLFILEFEHNITANGKIVSEKEWILSKRPDGSLISTLYDRKNNIVSHTSVFQVERGDIFTFNLNRSILNKNNITPFDTIGLIQSSETTLELAELEKKLAVAKGTLNINLTGTKEAVINQATKELDLAKEKSTLQNKIYEKQSALFDNKLISEDKLDNEKNIQKIYELQVKIAESNLINLQTGSKPELIQMINEEIFSIEKEINIVKQKMKNYVLFSPIDGKIYKTFSEDTIAYLGSDKKIAIIPIDITIRNDIKNGQMVTITNNLHDKNITGKILNINKMVKYINNKQTTIAIVVLDDDYLDIPLNLILECEINTENRTGFQHLERFLINIFN